MAIRAAKTDRRAMSLATHAALQKHAGHERRGHDLRSQPLRQQAQPQAQPTQVESFSVPSLQRRKTTETRAQRLQQATRKTASDLSLRATGCSPVVCATRAEEQEDRRALAA